MAPDMADLSQGYMDVRPAPSSVKHYTLLTPDGTLHEFEAKTLSERHAAIEAILGEDGYEHGNWGLCYRDERGQLSEPTGSLGQQLLEKMKKKS